MVTPPPVPVTVMVRVPVVAVEATMTCMAAVPAPGAAMEAGLKATFTPVPCPEAVKATAELKPPETVVVIFERAWPPRAMLNVLGAAARVNVPPVVPVTVRVTVVVSTVLPEVPFTVIG